MSLAPPTVGGMPHAALTLPAALAHVHAHDPAQFAAEAVEVVYPGGQRALQPTTIRFEPGRITVLLGASGAGKSTLLRCLNGLVRPTAGRVLVPRHGDISQAIALRRHRRECGMVFQQHHLIGRLSVLDNVLMGRLGQRTLAASLWPWARQERKQALAAIDRFGLLAHALQRADQLSGGQQQRVGVARALVQQPRLLLADEPVASLDPASAERLLSLLHGICRSDGLTAVISLHQLDFARRFANRVVGLAAGSAVFDGPPQALDGEAASRLYAQGPADHSMKD